MGRVDFAFRSALGADEIFGSERISLYSAPISPKRGREVSNNEPAGPQEGAPGAPRVAIICETVPPTGQQMDAFQDGLHILASWLIRRHMREGLKLQKIPPKSP